MTTASHTAGNSTDTRFAHLRIERKDSWKPLTGLALIGMMIAVAFAVVGLPPVDLHTPLHHAGIMDPFCGGTRSIRYAAMGNWAESIRYNPLGLLFFLGFVAVIARAIVGFTTHRWYTLSFNWTRSRGRAAVIVVLLMLVALEIRQQSIAPLLMAR